MTTAMTTADLWVETARITVWHGRPVPRRVLHADPYCARVLALSRVDGPQLLVPAGAAVCACVGAGAVSPELRRSA